MKLYTQEQVNEIMVYLQKATLPENIECDGAYCMGCWKDVVRETLKKMANLSPIELPSDEEIEKAYEFLGTWTAKEIMQRSTSFQHGAKWVINRIKQQDK
jgi:hypothetical protein